MDLRTNVRKYRHARETTGFKENMTTSINQGTLWWHKMHQTCIYERAFVKFRVGAYHCSIHEFTASKDVVDRLSTHRQPLHNGNVELHPEFQRWEDRVQRFL